MINASGDAPVDFPQLGTRTYLNHAEYGPLPRQATEAIAGVARALSSPVGPDIEAAYEATIVTAQRHVAALVHGAPERVAFASSASDAMGLCANGIAWRSGDNVVIPQGEHPSVVYPFLNLARFGVAVRLVAGDEGGPPDAARLASAIDARTRVVALAHVHFSSGFRHDLTTIGRFCQKRDVLLLVDATQSMGALPIDVVAAGIDVVLAHAYKWLLTCFGVAVIHFSERALKAIQPSRAGWASVAKGFDELDYSLDWHAGAARYHAGWANWLGIVAFNASADLLRAADPAVTERHTYKLIDRLLAAVDEAGYRVTSCQQPKHRSAIVSFTGGDNESDAWIMAEFDRAQVAVSLREQGIRVSPHFHNSTADIDRLIDALPRR